MSLEVETPSLRVTKLFDQAKTSLISRNLEQILLNHMDYPGQFPSEILEDIRILAVYYAHHPEAVRLIESIADSEWKLKYAAHTFRTNIRGSRMSVKKVEVFFDPRSAAKLKFYDGCEEHKRFCIASPADALLHELLHVQTITNDVKAFIGQGGLDTKGYPIEHERLTIMKENVLYRSMTQMDDQPRPLRSEHNGRHVLVSCVTCVN